MQNGHPILIGDRSSFTEERAGRTRSSRLRSVEKPCALIVRKGGVLSQSFDILINQVEIGAAFPNLENEWIRTHNANSLRIRFHDSPVFGIFERHGKIRLIEAHPSALAFTIDARDFLQLDWPAITRLIACPHAF